MIDGINKYSNFKRFSNSLLASKVKYKNDLTKKSEQDNKKFLLLYSDFENFRKRKSEEISGILKNANKDLIYSILSIIDDFEGAISSLDKHPAEVNPKEEYIKGVYSGLSLIMKNLLKKLEKYGLKPLKSLGMPFDPNLHEAIKHVSDESFDDDVIVKEYQKGYLLNGGLLRSSKVVVNIKK